MTDVWYGLLLGVAVSLPLWMLLAALQVEQAECLGA